MVPAPTLARILEPSISIMLARARVEAALGGHLVAFRLDHLVGEQAVRRVFVAAIVDPVLVMFERDMSVVFSWFKVGCFGSGWRWNG